MFTTFSASTSENLLGGRVGDCRSPSPASNRPRRHQVSRACGWCRAYRIKCDDKIPCRNCVSKGRQCAEKGANEVRTFALAVKEINRLKARVTELESQLSSTAYPPQISDQIPTLPENLDPLREHGGNRGSWEYFYLRIPNSEQIQCYGPASPFFFMRSISTCMRKALAPDYPQSSLQDDASFASLFWSIDKRSRSDDKRFPRRTNSTSQQIMSRWQEEYFLDFFWQSYHCIYPIVDEGEFKAHHNSIWIMPYEPRKPSALVDIILAVTMQYGTALLPPDITKPALNAGEKRKDAASAGRSYFRRCQALLVDDLENPSITSLQCHILSVIYLSNAGSHNTAHSSLALACRVAVILGLHREPLGELDQDKRNFHRRLWWTLYALEIKAAMGLGRPLAINFSEVTCCLPTDAPNAGSITTPGSAKMPELASCFTTNSQFSKLILAARSAYVTFYQKCADVLGLGQQNTFHGNPEALEVCARFLSSKMEYLNTWLCEAPDSLKMKRRGGESFSTDGSPLHVQPIVPLYQQRQQVFLELHYHTVAMNLLRHFINFSHPLSSSTPQAEANAIACVDHAITITKIIHQMLTGTDLLGGWLESFYWHGNAFLSLVGYTLAYPDGERTAEARRAIVLAISTFDIISSSLGIAISSAKMARELAAKVDLIVERGRAGSLPPSSSESNTCHLMRDSNNNSMNSGTAVAVQDPNLQDPFVSDDIDMLGSDEWSSEMPRHSVDFTSGSSWINPEGSLNLDAWGFGYDYNVDPYNLWVDPHGESCVGEEN